MDAQKLALMKKALRNLSSAIDVLSEREREQLKELILKGQVGTEEELRGYLSRLIAARSRQREKEKVKQAERQQAMRRAQREEEEGGSSSDAQASLESASEGDGGAAMDLEKDDDHEPAKLTGKVVDAKSRKPVPYVKVRVIGTSFNEETETTGVFIWEELPRSRQITLEFTRKDYKNATLQYRSTLDDEQHIVVKLVPKDGDDRKKDKKGGH